MKVEDMEGKLLKTIHAPTLTPWRILLHPPLLKTTDLALYTCASCGKCRFMDPTPDIGII